MPAGEIILVAYSQENLFLNSEPQITFFKILYRRYSNFAIETIKQTFKSEIKLGNKYSIQISRLADLLHKMWLVIETPNIPIIYDFYNNPDEKIKFKWTKDIGYALIDYVEIEINGKTITKHWGEFYNSLNKLNWNDFNGTTDELIGNLPEIIDYHYVKDGIGSYTLRIPLNFWFCNNSGDCLPLINCEFSPIKFNVKFNDFNKCGIFSPSNYINIQKYNGVSVLGEPLLQITPQGYSWAEFDSIDISSYNKETFDVESYNLYYRKISDNDFITNIDLNNIKIENALSSLQNYVIYGMYSGSVYIPSNASEDVNSVFSSKKYYINFDSDIFLKDAYLLCDFVYIDNEERVKFYNSKRNYLIDQVYLTTSYNINNLSFKNYLNTINCCKFILFMGQVEYFLNENVNYNFDYNTLFFNPKLINEALNFININKKNTIKELTFLYDSSKSQEILDMEVYSLMYPFYSYKKAKNKNGFGIKPFSLYTQNLQPSGTLNTSKLKTLEILSYFNKIDEIYNKYILKCYVVTYNYLRFSNGVSGTSFNSAY